MNEVVERDQMIEEMLRDAKLHELPSSLRDNPVIDGVEGIPTVVHELKSSGYVYVWDTKTFERVPILHYMVPIKMRQKYLDGTWRFTEVKPKQEPKQGKVKCLLHADNPDRAHYDELGLKACRKSNITNPFQLQMHMKKKHPQEMATIEAEKKEKEMQEERELRRLLLQTQAGIQRPMRGEVDVRVAQLKEELERVRQQAGKLDRGGPAKEEELPWYEKEPVPYIKGQE